MGSPERRALHKTGNGELSITCRNRHCPTCQSQASVRWIEARRAELLPIPYFHVVFTLPHALNALAQGNPRVIYTLLFRAAADTLLAFGRDPRHLGGTIGITAILHTWSQTLTQHLHLHCLVTGGALSCDRTRWIHGRATFLFPVQALSVVFRAKYLARLQRAFTEGTLTFAAGTVPLADPGRFAALLAQLRSTPWVVYAKLRSRRLAGRRRCSSTSVGIPTGSRSPTHA